MDLVKDLDEAAYIADTSQNKLALVMHWLQQYVEPACPEGGLDVPVRHKALWGVFKTLEDVAKDLDRIQV